MCRCRSFKSFMRNISFPVSGFLIIKSPNPKFSRKAISKSAGSCFEFLLMNAHFNSFTAASLAISLDSMIIGRNGSLAFSSFANLRPASVYPELTHLSPLKEEIVSGTDIMIIRELTGDVYFGTPKGIEIKNNEKFGFNNMCYYESEISRIAHIAFKTAMQRNKKLCSVDKANVLDVSRLWRETVSNIAKEYPQVELTHMYVDNAAMQIIKNPKQFDVILTGNIFGDILSDEASVLAGSLGLLPSASLSDNGPALYEPIHGSAPDLKGKNIVNPIAAILSAAMMLKYSFKRDDIYNCIVNAVRKTLKDGYRTKDIEQSGMRTISTSNMGDIIKDNILSSQ